jgi:Lar family restriction alleviation protein
MNEVLKACPFCGADAQAMTVMPDHWVECDSCGACTKICKTVDAAAERWNMRAKK